MSTSKTAGVMITTLVLSAALPRTAQGQFEPWAYAGWIESDFTASPLTDYEWANWLVGEWEGWALVGDEKAPQRQSFRITTNNRYLVTELERGSGADAYTGMGIFAYDTENDVSYGEWFGGLGDRNDGRGQRDGNKWVWHINRLGRKITRVITRVDENHFTAETEILYRDGRVLNTREELSRVK